MKTVDALKHFGGNSELTSILGLSTGAISQWGEFPPPLRQLQIEALSGGVLKADKSILPNRTKKNRLSTAQNKMILHTACEETQA